MDIFKLLARSTNIQKSGLKAEEASQDVLPSIGLRDENIRNARVEYGFESFSLKRDPHKTKRKRVPEDGVSDVERPSNIDHARKNCRPLVSGTENHSLTDLGAAEQQSTWKDVTSLSDATDRQILKQKKIRITILRDESPRYNHAVASEGATKSSKKKQSYVQVYPRPLTSFQDLRTHYGISKRLAENLHAQGYRYPTEVQLGSLPMLLGSDEERGLSHHKLRSSKQRDQKDFHVDMLTIAPTGSGKTLAFLLNVFHRLLQNSHGNKKADNTQNLEHQVRALIVAPTHELVDQIVNEGKKLIRGTGLHISAMKKGMCLATGSSTEHLQNSNRIKTDDPGASADEEYQRYHPNVKVDVLVSTPMHLVNAISENQSTSPNPLPAIRHLILDEADVLLDPLFREQTLAIWNACINPSLQVTLWSATIGSATESLTESMIFNRQRSLKIMSRQYLIRVVVGLKDSAVSNISHRLVYAATEQGKLLALRQLLHPSASSEDKEPHLRPPFLVFTQTIQRAAALHSELLYDIPPEAGGSKRIAVLHSGLSDSARSAIMAGFGRGDVWVLITTDLLSRGIDFRGMNGVVNYDIPATSATYVHRAGRTGRQGRAGGIAITLYTKEDIPYVKNIANVIAAGEKAKLKGGENSGGSGAMEKWLLDSLPDVSKRQKQQLKKRGVESRRALASGKHDKAKRRAKISTKSGYDRKLEHRKQGLTQRASVRDSLAASEDEWSGIED